MHSKGGEGEHTTLTMSIQVLFQNFDSISNLKGQTSSVRMADGKVESEDGGRKADDSMRGGR